MTNWIAICQSLQVTVHHNFCVELFNRMYLIQSILKENEIISHLELLKILEPELCHMYSNTYIKNPNSRECVYSY